MILTIFITLLAISFGLLILDFIQRSNTISEYEEYPFIAIMGWFVLFVAGVSILITGLYYPSGSMTTEEYYYLNSSLNYTVENETIQYLEIQGDFILFDMSHILGFFIAALAAGGLAVSWFNYSRGGINVYED
jgi:multisubunit Na+/H+ antiporter MnhB subunit